ncbi:MAG: DUF1801 domain-containing protein [Flavobacteriaceae bacterium]|nr:DUF1801 domain-containing protein [Flavobacteriaceae bacterium]
MKEITDYIEKKTQWKAALELLRSTLLTTDLEEALKWGMPVYVVNGKNIVGLSAFKSYVGLWFFQGGTLKDEKNVLLNAQEGKTNAMRQWRFSSIDEIDPKLVVSYVNEAIANQASGNIIKPKKKNAKPLVIHKLFQQELDKNSQLVKQFEGFNLTKKREFAAYISDAKRETTQLKRMEKIIPMILDGSGLYDKYKNC